MTREFSMSSRRLGVTINFLCVVLFVIFFSIGEYGKWNPFLIGCSVVLFLASVFSYIPIYIKTGIWKVARSKSAVLDEREIKLVHDAYRRSYDLFTVICLVIVFFIFLTVRYSFFTLTPRGHYSFGLIILLFLNYLLNTLPPAIIAWTEPRVEK